MILTDTQYLDYLQHLDNARYLKGQGRTLAEIKSYLEAEGAKGRVLAAVLEVL